MEPLCDAPHNCSVTLQSFFSGYYFDREMVFAFTYAPSLVAPSNAYSFYTLPLFRTGIHCYWRRAFSYPSWLFFSVIESGDGHTMIITCRFVDSRYHVIRVIGNENDTIALGENAFGKAMFHQELIHCIRV